MRLRTVQCTNRVQGHGIGMCMKVIHTKLGLLSIKVRSCLFIYYSYRIHLKVGLFNLYMSFDILTSGNYYFVYS